MEEHLSNNLQNELKGTIEKGRNILDKLNATFDKKSKTLHVDARTSGFNKETGVNTIIDGNFLEIIRYSGSSATWLTLNGDYGYQINLTQAGIPVPEMTSNDSIDNNITIYQSE